MEEVQTEDPVSYIWSVHKAQLALAGGILNVGGDWELVRYVVYLK